MERIFSFVKPKHLHKKIFTQHLFCEHEHHYLKILFCYLVTGLDLWTAVLSTGIVCIFYTALVS